MTKSMLSKAQSFLLAAGLAAALVAPATAQTATTFTYQGVLSENGSAVDGLENIRFRLFDAPTGGTLFAETTMNVDVEDGVFSAQLNFGPLNTVDLPDAWLEIAVNTAPGTFETIGRQQLTATPFALNTRGIDVDAAGVVSPSAANVSMGKVDTGDGIYNFLDDSTGSVVGNYVRFLANNDTELSALGFLRFQVGFDEQMLIRPDFTLINNELHTMERVGIGTTNPARRLHLRGADGFMLVERDNNPAGVILRTFDDDTYTTETSEWRMLSGNDGNFQLQNANNGFTTPFVVSPTDRVGINTSAPAFDLEVNGSAGKPGGGSWSNSSDRRLKTNIAELDGALDTILALKGVTYEYKDAEAINELPGERIGFIAQDVEAVIPDWIDEGENGYKRMTIRGFEALAVEAIREQQTQIGLLEARIDSLESQRPVGFASMGWPVLLAGGAFGGVALTRRRLSKD